MSFQKALAELRGRRILVTGSTGFKGSWLCHWLTDLGATVHGFALPPAEDAPLFDQLRLRDRIVQHDGDIRDLDSMRAAVTASAPDLIIHLAAQALVRRSYADPKTTFDTNIGGAVNLLEAVREQPQVRALVFITSDKCYRNKEWAWGYRENDELGGADPYSASKAGAELVFAAYQDSFLLRRPGFGAASTRAGNVIGGGDFSADRIVPDCIRSLQAGRPLHLRSPDSTRPWQHVLEPLSGYLTLAARLLGGDPEVRSAWNFGPDPENVRTVQELAERALEVWGSGSLEVERDPNAPHEARLLMLNNDKAKTLLGWGARWDFDHAVAKTVLWYKRVSDGECPMAVTSEQIADYVGS